MVIFKDQVRLFYIAIISGTESPFRLARGDFMSQKRKSKGFVLLDTLFSFYLILLLLLWLIPSLLQIKTDTERLEARLYLQNTLQNKLIENYSELTTQTELTEKMFYENTTAQFKFTKEINLIKGCVSWVKKDNQLIEELCLYAHD